MTESKPENDEVVCSKCGRQNPRESAKCEGCSAELTGARPHRPFQFSLAQLFVVVTVCAIGMGIFVLAPGLGAAMCVLGLLTSPLWIKSLRPDVQPPTAIFAGVIVLSLLAAGLALFIKCASNIMSTITFH